MNNDRMQRQRFELKYLVDEHTALGIRNYVGALLDLDEAGQGKPRAVQFGVIDELLKS